MRMHSFFHRKKSKDIAKDRLKILLISDRFTCSPQTLELIRRDITQVLMKYITLDPDKLEIEVSKRKINVFW